MTRRQFVKLCETSNVRFEEDFEYGVLNIDPPVGYVLKGSGLHYLSVHDRGWSRSDLYDHIATDLADGLELCDIHDCDYCNSN